MKTKDKYKTDEFFWDLLLRARIKEQMAKLILTSREELITEKFGLAEEFTKESFLISFEVWDHFWKLNSKVVATSSLCADSATKTIREY